jgi:hypothetical protein
MYITPASIVGRFILDDKYARQSINVHSIVERNGKRFLIEHRERIEQRYVQIYDDTTRQMRLFEVTDVIPIRIVRSTKNVHKDSFADDRTSSKYVHRQRSSRIIDTMLDNGMFIYHHRSFASDYSTDQVRQYRSDVIYIDSISKTNNGWTYRRKNIRFNSNQTQRRKQRSKVNCIESFGKIEHDSSAYSN